MRDDGACRPRAFTRRVQDFYKRAVRERGLFIVFAILLLSFGSTVPGAARPQPEGGPPTSEELAGGEALAERLRTSVPEENSEFKGKLIIKSEGVSTEIPITCRVSVTSTNWETDYETTGTAQFGPERLVVLHSTNGPNHYLYARALSPSAPLPKLGPLPKAEVTNSLAGSDFSLEDFALEFLHWPLQRQLKGEMRLGQPCYVLESSDPKAGEIVRVKSYIDKESGGPLIADGYDAEGHLVKEYSLHGSSFKKVNGRWQVEKMDIRNKKTGSHTELKLDLSK